MDPGAGSSNPKRFRQPSSPHDGHLNLSAKAWLKELPPDVVPVALANRYPRIVNRLSRFWDSPKMISECFRELLVHRRAGRDGFSEDVLLELFALEQYHHETHKTSETDTWVSIPPRRP